MIWERLSFSPLLTLLSYLGVLHHHFAVGHKIFILILNVLFIQWLFRYQHFIVTTIVHFLYSVMQNYLFDSAPRSPLRHISGSSSTSGDCRPFCLHLHLHLIPVAGSAFFCALSSTNARRFRSQYSQSGARRAHAYAELESRYK